MAQLVVSAAGAVAGFMIGGPTGAQIGWTLGSMAYGMLNPTKTAGPRLSDLKVSGTEYGQCIPYCLGNSRLAGQIIYASQKYEIADTQSAGKGGGQEYTSYTYEVDLLYLLTDNEMEGVSRIWLNGELVWTCLDSADAASFEASFSSEKWQRMTVYKGASDQLPDPDYEAAVTNAPAYRGRCTVFFKRLKLGNSGQIPQLTFEAFGTGVIGSREVTFLLRGDNGFTEEINSESLTVNNTVNASSSLGPFSNGALIFDDAYPGNNRLTSSSRSSFDFEDGDFCIEAWVYVSAINYPTAGTSIVRVCRSDTGITDTGLWISNDGTGLQKLQAWSPSAGRSGGVVPKDTWNHVVVSRNGGTYYLYMNGVLQNSWSDSYWRVGGSRYVFIGQFSTTNLYMLIAGVRITKGWYRYTDGYAIPTSLPVNTGNTVTLVERDLQSVVEALCDRAGMPAGSYDASALASITKPVRSLAISQIGATRATLEVLMQSHYFGAYITDKLRFMPRGAASVASIPFADLGATTGETVEPLALQWANELELPATVSISYANVDGDYNTATEESDRLLTSQGSTSAMQLALGMTSAEAKGIANTAIADNVAALLTSTIHLPSSYSHLIPTDVVTILDRDGSSYRMRITKRTDSAGVLQLEVVRDDAQALQDVGISSTDYTPSTTVAGAVDTLMVPLDTPLLRDEDDSPGYMLAARGTGRPWPGGAGYASADGGTTYSQVSTFTASSVIGITTTVLPAWTGIGMDTANTVTVTLGDGQQLASTTRDALFADETVNALMFETGELVRFLTATLVSGSTYTLSGLLRGCRGTEWAMGLHAVGEDVVVLGNALRRVSMLTAEIGAARQLKGVTANRALSTGTVLSFTPSAVCLKPVAPVQGAYAGGVLSWRRRSRYATQLFGPAGPVCPLGESAEAYEVDLVDGSNAVLSTISTTTPSCTISGYTVAASISGQADMRQVGSLLIGVNEAYPNQTDADVLTAWQPDGSALVASANLGGAYAWQVADDGTYVYTAEVTPSGGSAVRKWTATAISSGAVATYSTASGNAQGVAVVGSQVWASEYYSERLVVLDAAMTEVSSYSLTGSNPRRMHYDGTSLWVCLAGNELLQHDPATNTEVRRITLADMPYDVRSNGTVVVVACYSAIYTYLVADGSLVDTITASLGFNGRGGYLSTDGSKIYAADIATSRLLVISASGQLESFSPIIGLRGIGGIQASGAPLAVRVTGSPATATTVLLDESGAASAVKARVYQLSSVVGRGYPLEIPLT